jgi:hypothetical protein
MTRVQVTRQLEQGAALAVVFVCRSAEPAMLTRHVLQLAAQRGVPVCAFNFLGSRLAQLLRIPKVAVMAVAAPAEPIGQPSDPVQTLAAAIRLLCERTAPAAIALGAPHTPTQVRRVPVVGKRPASKDTNPPAKRAKTGK